ncbi:hypothetical protein HID58_061945 [Brassica napus]|uniref:Uncharacterized protein n=1 Tax=Brassica napus TaxID=3708 RepID=A0ABQ8A045_BRANA|nr:hypothetical protein HID58_061945 [Brassica napus]
MVEPHGIRVDHLLRIVLDAQRVDETERNCCRSLTVVVASARINASSPRINAPFHFRRMVK